MYLVNIDWQYGKSKNVIIRNNGRKIPVTVPDGKMLSVDLKTKTPFKK